MNDNAADGMVLVFAKFLWQALFIVIGRKRKKATHLQVLCDFAAPIDTLTI
jgi:hypothetical protein